MAENQTIRWKAEKMAEEMDRIAKLRLGFETLESRGSDRLDFREVSVWAVEQALRDAYVAGMEAARR